MSEEQTNTAPTETKSVTADEFNNLSRADREQLINNGNLSPEDAAAAFFTLHSPRFFELVDNMSLRELKRTIKNAVTYPFNNHLFKAQTQIEQRALYIANELLMNKATMQLYFEMEKVEEAAKLEEQTKLEQQNNNNEGEKTNG